MNVCVINYTAHDVRFALGTHWFAIVVVAVVLVYCGMCVYMCLFLYVCVIVILL